MGELKVFTRKPYNSSLYKWSVRSGVQDKVFNKQTNLISCTATVGSQGQDFTVGYVYNTVVINGQIERLAYVVCGYVQ